MQASDITALILAGGRGTRLAGLYPDVPKPMVPVAGRPFLDWLVRWLAVQGVRQVALSTGYKGDKIEAWADQAAFEVPIHLSYRRETDALGTGGGAVLCLDLCGDTVFILNGDSLLAFDITPALTALDDMSLDGVLIGAAVDDTSRYGSLAIDEDGLLQGFREKQPGQGLINAGLYFFRKRSFTPYTAGQNYSMEYDLIPDMLKRGLRLKVIPAGNAPFLDIGTPETVALAEGFVHDNGAYFLASL
jgi:NDP-sugar pyrophosphorylase family protein